MSGFYCGVKEARGAHLGCESQCDYCFDYEHEEAEEVADRSDIGPAVCLWPAAKLPAFLRVGADDDLTMIGGVR